MVLLSVIYQRLRFSVAILENSGESKQLSGRRTASSGSTQSNVAR